MNINKRRRGGKRIRNASTGPQLGLLLRAFMVGKRDRDGLIKEFTISELVAFVKLMIASGLFRTASQTDAALRNHIQTYIGRQVRNKNSLWRRTGPRNDRRFSFLGK